MRLAHTALIVLLLAPALLSAQQNLGTYEDRIAVEDVMARYVWSVDSLDADGYVAVFTEDAVIDSNGSISKGHEQMRSRLLGLQVRFSGRPLRPFRMASVTFCGEKADPTAAP